MITIPDTLRPVQVNLALPDASRDAAIARVARLLAGDERVLDWNALFTGIQSKDPCLADGREFDICIPHARTPAVRTMVMAAGRSATGFERGAGKPRVHYIFVIGVPVAMAADYLRILGALSRIFRDENAERQLRATDSARAFVELLGAFEMQL